MTKKYSFQNSKRLPEERMTLIGDIQVPAVPGTSHHAILCALIDNKNKFVTWKKIVKLVEEYMVMYGGEEVWKKFLGRKRKDNNETILKKVKTNTHTLTKTGKNCYGYRLHERGIVIYYFKDGAMARTGGRFISAKRRKPYNVRFHVGTGLQLGIDEKIMSYREYKDFYGGNWHPEEEIDVI